jgi:peroxiredoxin
MTLLFRSISTIVAYMMAFTASSHSDAPKEFTTQIRGTVIDRPYSKTVIMTRIYENQMVHGVEIPIVDGKFSHDLTTDTREMWELVFYDESMRGAWRPVRFFSEPGTVEMTLYPMDRHDENRLEGGILNTEYAALQDLKELWWKIKKEETAKLEKRGYKPKSISSINGEWIIEEPDTSTPEGLALHEEFLALEKRTMPGMELEYYRNNPTIVSYSHLYMGIKSLQNPDKTMMQPYIDVYNEVGYVEKFQDSPYTREIANLLGALGNIRVGGRYIDFTLPDLDGNNVTVSEYIAGKVALIDLWMPWCGPCRRSAIETIPVWEEFRDKGFTVIGASGDSNLETIRKAASKDGYPWPTLVDLRGSAGIWSKYGISNAGGSRYLIDRDGTILAINPNEEQLREILSLKL